MTHIAGDGWISDKAKNTDVDDPQSSSKDFHHKQQGKTMKAAIGIAILVVVALVLSWVHPVSHSSSPSIITTETNRTQGPTTGQPPAQTPPRAATDRGG